MPDLFDSYNEFSVPGLLYSDDEFEFMDCDAAEHWEGEEWIGNVGKTGELSKEEAEVHMADYLLGK